jgi:hypothetical protein
MVRRATESAHEDRVDRVRLALRSWEDLNKVIAEWDEEDVMHAMREEMDGAKRDSFIKRLAQRLNGIKIEQAKKEVEEVIDEEEGRDRRRDRTRRKPS